MKALILLAIALTLITSAAQSAPDSAVAYTVTPELKKGVLQDLKVDLSFRAAADGQTTLDLPDSFASEKALWRHIAGLKVIGGALAPGAGAKRRVISPPGAWLKVSYRVLSAYDADPNGAEGNPHRGAVIRPTWFWGLGDTLYITPEGRDDAPADFAWGPLPRGWTASSSLDPGHRKQKIAVSDLIASTMIGGADVKLYSKPIERGTLRVALRGAWAFNETAFVDAMAEVISAQRRFWGGEGGPYFVNVLPLAASPGVTSIGGTGRSGGFALYGTLNADMPTIKRLLAHEHTHNWLPFQMGIVPEGQAEASEFWFSEGFTDFYTDRTLLRAGLWTPEQFAQHMNTVLRDYAASPVHAAPNSQIVSGFWSDPNLQKLPYQRGYLLAFLWDYRLRRIRSKTVGLDDIVFAMRDHYAAAAPNAKPDLVKNFQDTVQRLSGLDLGPDLDKFVVAGEAFTLPEDLFGSCAKVEMTPAPLFDLGYDPEASAAKGGVFTGVAPTGPAYAAGLRDGMKRVARDAGEFGNPSVEIVYRVQDASGAERVIRYFPASRETVTIQKVTLTPAATPEQAQTCVNQISGL